MKRIVAGIVAHVDAGKTTLSEALLYRTGEIRRLGRVDHGDAFLDTNALEKARGITIFAHQAMVEHGSLRLSLLDTPGHVDFAAETERVLRVLDYAILVVSGIDGVQGHTETLWRLLARYHVPTFVFVNKCDADGFDKTHIMAQLKRRLSDGCADFGPLSRGVGDGSANDGDEVGEAATLPQDAWEDLAMQDELAMDEFLETGTVGDERLRAMIATRKVFPVYCGSALKLEGVETFLDGLERFCVEPQWPEEFRARVFKISHDSQHNRMTWLRVTGGTLKAKAMIAPYGGAGNSAGDGVGFGDGVIGGVTSGEEATHAEKIDQVRVYNGAKYETVTEVPAGAVCAVTGPERTFPGEGLGAEPHAESPSLQPVLTYTVLPAAGADESSSGSAEHFDDLTLHRVLTALRELEDEDPLLHVVWVERLGEIHVQLMGTVQLEIIASMLHDRFGLDVSFGPGSILYRETITAPIEGVGHFEPLRHYAEAHILLEPGEPGSGIRVASAVSLNELDRNWQRLILTHLTERDHLGVLTGAPLTDLKMTLVAGRAHLKHTEGGDFRQATYRAIRQGLMEAAAGVIGHPNAEQVAAGRVEGTGNCRVLEPWYRFRLEVPSPMLGRAMSDIQRMSGNFESPETDGEYALIEGEAPVAEMRDYAMDVNQYTHGRGRLQATFGGYKPCHDADRVIEEANYDPEADLDNTPDSVFCAHGAGYPVKWYRVPDFMHLGWATDGTSVQQADGEV
nr:TetM/TetW/TetO/TetS family tetracycline resistance ribosomal protection protein [Bifidobacterium sp. DSM 109957]